MAKKPPSKHSRAARRATSPSINTDKSLKNVQAPAPSTDHRPSILGLHQAAGVTKKTRKQGRKAAPSARARRRADRGADRAEQIMDRTQAKVQRSKAASRAIQSRSRGWDEINGEVDAAAAAAEAVESASRAKRRDAGAQRVQRARDAEQEAVDRFYADTDEEMDEVAEEDGKAAEGVRNGTVVGPDADDGDDL
ncbi:uncharacterized protein E0L32_001936 [Thyridium curvatum]|uniref:Alb1-domain-containing protein n=1 Tax=Thyridium curvatum TaxID=1093900 RepID=A0A507ATH1_9PEZI|nr:uncharacterized protein E0L32_001743 [Thyridium curvatum]XP_030990072.1 uncharacterized protein E0L32_001936 [Thyridium curvatum]TPX08168.1 hypothetical protein E0L32_001743 [Thyridium curvatum]TPX08361.1 hypothetical protein E0L32_001936 [Thyridium curvatum]